MIDQAMSAARPTATVAEDFPWDAVAADLKTKIVEEVGAQARDMRKRMEEQVAAIPVVREIQVKTVTERVVVLVSPTGEEKTISDRTHPLFPRLLRYLAAGSNV